MKVGVIFGGRSVEHQVSIASARTVAGGLAQAGHRVIPLGIAQDGCWVDRATSEAALAGELSILPAAGGPVAPTLRHLLAAGAEVLFPIVHGTWGEDGTLQGLCEMVGLPYVGCGVEASALAMDKVATKQLLAAAGLPVVPCEAVSGREFEAAPDAFLARAGRLPPPLFVKPRVGGSSVGIQKVEDLSCLATAVRFALRFDDSVLVERGIRGRELECAVLGHGEVEASAVGEIVPGREFYDYTDKYLEEGARLIAPADLPAALAERIQALAVAAFGVLGGSGMARVDFLLEGETPWLNELNTLPGFTAISMYPRLWDLSGVPLPRLVDRLVQLAVQRHRERQRLDQGIKEWLAELARRRE